MAYPEIVALLDEQIAKLEKVRVLLAPQLAVPEENLPAAPARQIEAPRVGSVVQRLRPRQRRERGVRRPQTEHEARGRTALSGSVPLGPVAVSADAARTAQATRRPPAGGSAQVAAVQDISAEKLLQRWLRPKDGSAAR